MKKCDFEEVEEICQRVHNLENRLNQDDQVLKIKNTFLKEIIRDSVDQVNADRREKRLLKSYLMSTENLRMKSVDVSEYLMRKLS